VPADTLIEEEGVRVKGICPVLSLTSTIVLIIGSY